MTIDTSSLVLDDLAQRTLFTEARSPMHFDDRPVPLDVVRSAYDLVKWGPTGSNSMPLRLAIADSPGARATVIVHAAPGNRPKVETSPLVLVVASDRDYHEFSHVTAAGVEGLRAAGLAVRPMGGFDHEGLTRDLLAGTAWHAEALLAVGYPEPHGNDGTGPRQGRPDWDQAARVF